MPLLRVCKSITCPICEDGKVSDEFSTNSMSKIRFNCKSSSMKNIKEGRLSGGADANNVKENHPESQPENLAESGSILLPTEKTDFMKKQTTRAGDSCCVCGTHLTGTAGEDKVNEIIEYAHQNLQDAGKALATLEENFEHGLKLAIADVLGRIQQWSNTVQNKLDVCKNDIENLRKELLSRNCDINNKDRKIADLDEQIADLNAKIADLLSQIDKLKQQIDECAAKKAECDKILAEKEELLRQKPEPSPAPAPAPVPPPPKVEPPKTIEESPKPPPAEPKVEKVEKPKKMEEPKKVLEQNREKEKERKRREAELEAEIARLRKEIEKLKKEKIDYENAIQRALLRGVSSLNVEALRVLRCPPIPCCSPCVPCPMSLGITAEQTVPCPMRTKRTSTTQAANKICSRGNGNEKNSKYDQCDHTVKQPCASPCCPAEKNQHVSDNSMYFLLHQGDAENVCGAKEPPPPRPCGTPFMKCIEIPTCRRFSRP